jgi:hypothetical protein
MDILGEKPPHNLDLNQSGWVRSVFGNSNICCQVGSNAHGGVDGGHYRAIVSASQRGIANYAAIGHANTITAVRLKRNAAMVTSGSQGAVPQA